MKKNSGGDKELRVLDSSLIPSSSSELWDYEKLESLEEKSNAIDWALVKEILINTGNRIICFDYSFVVIVLLYAIGQLKDDQGDNTNSKAASPLIIYAFNLAVTLSIYPALSLLTAGSRFLGEIGSENDAIRADGIRKYSRLPRNTFLVSLPFTLMASSSMAYADKFWHALGEEQAVTDLVRQFTLPGSLLMPVFLFRFLNEIPLYLQNKGSVVAITNLSSLAIGLILCETLSFNFFGQLSGPSLGIFGLLLGVCAQILLSWLTLNGYIFKSREFEKFKFRQNIFSWFPEDTKQILELFPLAFAYACTAIAELSTQIFNSRLAGSLGTDQLAAWDYVALVAFTQMLWSHAISQVMQQMIGKNLSENKIVATNKIAKYGLVTSLVFPFPNLIFLILGIYPDCLIKMDTTQSNSNVQAYARTLIRVASASSWLANGVFTMVESLKPTKNYQKPVYWTIGSLWLGALTSYFLSQKMDIYGVIVGNLTGVIVGGIGVLHSWRKNFYTSAQQPEPVLRINSDDSLKSRDNYSCFSRLKQRFFGKPKNPDSESLPFANSSYLP